MYIFGVSTLLLILQIVLCRSKNWMQSKSWIEDYRGTAMYGLPAQPAPTEYSMETHKIGVVQKEGEKFAEEGGYDFSESSSVRGTTRTDAIHNKGKKFVGKSISDLIIIPKNASHSFPAIRVDMILLDRVTDDTVNFVGLLESPKSDGYSSISRSVRGQARSPFVSYEFVLCGNHRRKDMLSVGYIEVHHDNDNDLETSDIQEIPVVNPYLFMAAVKSIAVDRTSLGECKEFNVRGAVFDNTVPGIYLPFTIYRRFMATISEHGIRNNFTDEMKIWERRSYVCFEQPVDWRHFPKMSVAFFANENDVVEITYSGESIVHRYYSRSSGKSTYCYIFAIRKGIDDRLIFGRAAFEGIRLIFNRTKKAIRFVENSCCGPEIKLRRITQTEERMSSCLPEKLKLQAQTQASSSFFQAQDSSSFFQAQDSSSFFQAQDSSSFFQAEDSSSFFQVYGLWILIAGIVCAIILACLLLLIPKRRRRSRPAAIHVFIPQPGSMICATNCPGRSETQPTE